MTSSPSPSASPEPNWFDIDERASDDDFKSYAHASQLHLSFAHVNENIEQTTKTRRNQSSGGKSDNRGGKSEDDREDVSVASEDTKHDDEELELDRERTPSATPQPTPREPEPEESSLDEMSLFGERFGLHAISYSIFHKALSVDLLLFVSTGTWMPSAKS